MKKYKELYEKSNFVAGMALGVFTYLVLMLWFVITPILISSASTFGVILGLILILINIYFTTRLITSIIKFAKRDFTKE